MNKAFLVSLYLTCLLGTAQAQTLRFSSQDIARGCRSGIIVGEDRLNQDEIRVLFKGAQNAIVGRVSTTQGMIQGQQIVGVTDLATVSLNKQGHVTAVEPLMPLFTPRERNDFNQRTARYKEAVEHCARQRPGAQSGF